VTSNNNNISSNKVSSLALHDTSNNAPHVIAMPLTKHLPQNHLQNHSGSNTLCFLWWLVYFVWLGIEKTSLTLSCQLWYQHPSWLLTLWTKRDSGLSQGIASTIVAENRHRRGRVTSWHLICLLSIKLGSWSCQLWYQHPLRLLTLWTKRDSGLSQGIASTIVAENRHRRERVTSWHLICLLSIKLGSWSCQLWYQHPSRLLTLWTKRDSGLLWGIVDYCCGEQTQGEKSDVLTFDLFAQH
jgi:hypothetical protein